MKLPPAVQRKVDRANTLMTEAGGTPTPGLSPQSPELEAARAEIARLEKLVNDGRVEQGRVRSMAEEIERLKEELKAKETTAQLDAGKINALTEDDERLLGDLKDPVVKAAREIVQSEIAAAMLPVQERFKHVGRITDAQFYALLDDYCPGWEAQNDDKAFIAWLGQIDPGTGKVRQDLLGIAEQLRQAARVSEFFNAFREKRDINLGGRQDSPRNLDHGLGLGDQPIEQTADAGVVTRAFITQFYRDRRSGKYKDRPEESAKIEAQINEAVSTGKVR